MAFKFPEVALPMGFCTLGKAYSGSRLILQRRVGGGTRTSLERFRCICAGLFEGNDEAM